MSPDRARDGHDQDALKYWAHKTAARHFGDAARSSGEWKFYATYPREQVGGGGGGVYYQW